MNNIKYLVIDKLNEYDNTVEFRESLNEIINDINKSEESKVTINIYTKENGNTIYNLPKDYTNKIFDVLTDQLNKKLETLKGDINRILSDNIH